MSDQQSGRRPQDGPSRLAAGHLSGSHGLSETKKSKCITPGLPRKRVFPQTQLLRKTPPRVGQESRFIALAAARDGSEVGRVGLQNERLDRRGAHDFADPIALLEGERAADPEEEAHARKAERLVASSAEAVDDAPDPGKVVLPDEIDQRAVGLAAVDDKGQAELARELRLGEKRLDLPLARGVVVVEVQSHLADRREPRRRNRLLAAPWALSWRAFSAFVGSETASIRGARFGVRGWGFVRPRVTLGATKSAAAKRAQISRNGFAPFLGVVRVNARRRAKTHRAVGRFPNAGQSDCLTARFETIAHDDDVIHAGANCAGKDVIEIVGELLVGQMTMRVEPHGSLALWISDLFRISGFVFRISGFALRISLFGEAAARGPIPPGGSAS